jgi:hypothetical protein
MIIAVDFDGTVVDHIYPDVGRDVPGAVYWLKEIVRAGGRLILWTMRSPDSKDGNVLQDAVDWFDRNRIPLFGANKNPQQSWSSSPKAYAHLYVDDAAFGCPLKENPRSGGRPYVDWEVVGPAIVAQLKEKK